MLLSIFLRLKVGGVNQVSHENEKIYLRFQILSNGTEVSIDHLP